LKDLEPLSNPIWIDSTKTALVERLELFCDDPSHSDMFQCGMNTRVSLDVSRAFVEFAQGSPITVRANTVLGLRDLGEEMCFPVFVVECERFLETRRHSEIMAYLPDIGGDW
jgi:hypothetical protein